MGKKRIPEEVFHVGMSFLEFTSDINVNYDPQTEVITKARLSKRGVWVSLPE
jgi:hypothetical protein